MAATSKWCVFCGGGATGVVTETTRSPVTDSPDGAQFVVLLANLAIGLLPAMNWFCRLQGEGHSGSWDSRTGRGRAERKGQKVRDNVAAVKKTKNKKTLHFMVRAHYSLASSSAGQSMIAYPPNTHTHTAGFAAWSCIYKCASVCMPPPVWTRTNIVGLRGRTAFWPLLLKVKGTSTSRYFLPWSSKGHINSKENRRRSLEFREQQQHHCIFIFFSSLKFQFKKLFPEKVANVFRLVAVKSHTVLSARIMPHNCWNSPLCCLFYGGHLINWSVNVLVQPWRSVSFKLGGAAHSEVHATGGYLSSCFRSAVSSESAHSALTCRLRRVHASRGAKLPLRDWLISNLC